MFSYLVNVGHISSNPVSVKISANTQECVELSKIWKVDGVESLEADLEVTRWKRDGVRVKGNIKAVLNQTCVITLEPIVSNIANKIEVLVVPEGSKLARIPLDENGEMVLSIDAPDIPETFSGDKVDLGMIVAEYTALEINLYPRCENAEFKTEKSVVEEPVKRKSPFADLQKLRDETK